MDEPKMISEIDIKDMQPVIEVVEVKENEDGTADCELRLNHPAVKFLLNFAFVSVLKNALEEGRGNTPTKDEA